MINFKQNVLDNLERTKSDWLVVSEQSGVPFHTLNKIGRGITKNAGIDHMQALYNYFNK